MGVFSEWMNHRFSLLFGLGTLIVLYVIERHNFLLFHGLVEVFSILVAFAVFVIAWNTRDELDNSYLAIIGISYLFIGGVDLLHTFAYKGMGVFPAAGADLPTQLWIFGRYLEAMSLLAAGIVGFHSMTNSDRLTHWVQSRQPAVAVVYGVVVALGLASIFTWDIFPQTYVSDSGLTRFKVVSEYVIIGLLGLAIVFLAKQRERFSSRVYRLLVGAIVFSIVSELAFTFYTDVYGLSNAIGHYFKFGSFFLVYLAVVKTGLSDPQQTLYRKLSQREAEARKFKQAVEHSGHAVLITDTDGSIEFVNSAYEQMTGYAKEELLGQTPRLINSGVHDKQFYEDMWETIRNGDIWESEFINERKDGEVFVVKQTVAPVTDEDGTLQHFVGVNTDISERKRQEEQLRSRYKELFTSIQDAILVTDTNHRITNANPAFADLFDYELAEVRKRSIDFLYESDVEFAETKSTIEDKADEDRVTKTIEYQKKSGQTFPGKTTSSSLRDGDGNDIGIIHLIRDVSDREERMTQLQVLDRILRHNFRNDMSVIEAKAEMLRDATTGKLTEDANQILTKSRELRNTVDEERSVTTLLANTPDTTTIDLQTSVKAVVSHFRDAEEAAISVSVPDTCVVEAIPQLSMAIEEAIENAHLHSDQETPSIDVEVTCLETTVELRIADDGPGLPPMEYEVLEEGVSADSLYHGSGLGLWLITLIVEHSNGVVQFRENEPRGTVVLIRLPAETCET